MLALGVAWLAGSALRIRRRQVEEAMVLAGVADPRATALGMYRTLATSLVELLVVAGSRRTAGAGEPGPSRLALTEGARQALGEARSRGPVVIAASHTGNWELSAFALAEEAPVAVVAKPLRVGGVHAFMASLRSRMGVRVLCPEGALRSAREALAQGTIVVMPIDQVPDAASHATSCRFLGRDALVDRAPFALARRAGATILVAATEGPRIHVLASLEGRGASPSELARQATAHLEAHVRSHPSSWLWLHRRWKKLPQVRFPGYRGPMRSGSALPLSALVAAGILLASSCKSSDAGDAGDAGSAPASCRTMLFGRPAARTGLGEAECQPYQLPDGALNPCLQCDEDRSGPVFKAVAGRTRRNTGIASALCRPCDEVSPLVHRY